MLTRMSTGPSAATVCEGLRHGGIVADIGDGMRGLDAVAPSSSAKAATPSLLSMRGDGRTLAGEVAAQRLADAAGGTGDCDDLAREHHGVLSESFMASAIQARLAWRRWPQL